jgi:hypothetical protein
MKPLLHKQSEDSSLAVGASAYIEHASHVAISFAPITVENVPVEQLSHSASPDKTLYFPASHCTQIVPSEPVEPELHTQSVIMLLASTELEFSGH